MSTVGPAFTPAIDFVPGQNIGQDGGGWRVGPTDDFPVPAAEPSGEEEVEFPGMGSPFRYRSWGGLHPDVDGDNWESAFFRNAIITGLQDLELEIEQSWIGTAGGWFGVRAVSPLILKTYDGEYFPRYQNHTGESFRFLGMDMNGGEVNYFWQGMAWRAGGYSITDMLTGIVVWKGVQYQEAPKPTVTGPAQLGFAMFEQALQYASTISEDEAKTILNDRIGGVPPRVGKHIPLGVFAFFAQRGFDIRVNQPADVKDSGATDVEDSGIADQVGGDKKDPGDETSWRVGRIGDFVVGGDDQAEAPISGLFDGVQNGDLLAGDLADAFRAGGITITERDPNDGTLVEDRAVDPAPIFEFQGLDGAAGGIEGVADAKRLGLALQGVGLRGPAIDAFLDGRISITIERQGPGSAASYSTWWNSLGLGRQFFNEKGAFVVDPESKSIGDLFNEMWHAYYDQVIDQGRDPGFAEQLDELKNWLLDQEVGGYKAIPDGPIFSGGGSKKYSGTLERNLEEDFLDSWGTAGGYRGRALFFESPGEVVVDEYMSQLLDKLAAEHFRIAKDVAAGKMTGEEASERWRKVVAGETEVTRGVDTYFDSGRVTYTIESSPPSSLLDTLTERFGLGH